ALVISLGSEPGGAVDPSVVYNTVSGEYLVVWAALEGMDGHEIFGQRLDADGDPVGVDDFQISEMGVVGNSYRALNPRVAHNSLHNEYLVVWWGSDDQGGLVEGEYEIFGQRLDASGFEIGVDDFVISDAGDIGDPAYAAVYPDVAYNPDRDEYLVVWSGEDNVGGLVQDELEVFGQRLDATGREVGINDSRISEAGGTGSPAYSVYGSRVHYDSDRQEYLVVWSGEDDRGALLQCEFEIFGQRLDGDGVELGADDRRLSFMGGTGNCDYGAYFPASAGEVIVWEGSDDAELSVGEAEIFGIRRPEAPMFADDFESGDTLGWSLTSP
ncbi:MAG: hypothetical protein K8H90_07645, partial [Thermoanaerobaculia bacterium]|nr:hypothetical protein [Thermoanaerobaculia bacterium]